MPQSPPIEQLRLEATAKSYSCLTCRQRKVKCDRRVPCSSCTKAEKPCSFVPPVRGKRKRTKPPREGLHAKLRRYEELLMAHGVKVGESPGELRDDTVSSAASIGDAEMGAVDDDGDGDGDGDGEPVSERSRAKQPSVFGGSESKIVTRNGTSKYFDSAPWSSLGDDFQHPEISLQDEPKPDVVVTETDLFFDIDPGCRPLDLTSLHPTSEARQRILEIFIDRVDAVIKILHLPTFWSGLNDRLLDAKPLPKSLEAAAFAFYLVTACSMNEDESLEVFGVPLASVTAQYRRAARQALVNADFMSTYSPMTLCAYAIFLMCIRESYHCDTMYIFSGIGIRLARKMGLHRDGTILGLSPFVTEMRRRIWWYLIHVDYRASEVLGTKPSMDISSGDTKMPLNLNDEDLSPDMTELSPERKGITSNTLSLVKCEAIDALRKHSVTASRYDCVRWESLPSYMVRPLVKEIEDHVESKYLRYCDPSVPLHLFVALNARGMICKLRLFARTADECSQEPAKDAEDYLDHATRLLDYILIMQEGHGGVSKYTWHMGTSFLWNAMLNVMIEIRRRKVGPKVDSAWRLIGKVLSYYPEMYREQEPQKPVYRALGKWIIKVWDVCIDSSKSADGGPAEPATTPEFISSIRACQERSRFPSELSHDESAAHGSGYNNNNPKVDEQFFHDYNNYFPSYNSGGHHYVGMETLGGAYDLPDMLSLETDLRDATQWEHLLRGPDLFGASIVSQQM